MLFISTYTYIAAQDKQLVWADEFTYTGLPDSTKWSYDVGDGCPDLCGWGNNELQYYTKRRSKNCRVEEGKLIIEAHQEPFETREYTSTRLVSRFKGDFLYGRMEVCAKLPSGVGTWPAVWMLPTDWEYGGWPASGEIDMMEHVGYDPLKIYGTVHTQAYNHTNGTQKGGEIEQPNVEWEFNVYAVEWTEEKIDFYVNDSLYFTFENDKTGFEAWPFDKRFHFILNIAVGGNWGGSKGLNPNIWPQRMEVDYVRVYH